MAEQAQNLAEWAQRLAERAESLAQSNRRLRHAEQARDVARDAQHDAESRQRLAEDLAVQLETERALLASVLAHIPVGIVVAEAPSGRMILSNTQGDRIAGGIPLAGDVDGYGRYRGTHANKSLLQLDDWPLVRAIRRGETVLGEEILFERGDGTWITLLVSAVPIHDPNGQVIAALAIADDISERKQAEEERARLLAAEQEARAQAEQAVQVRDHLLSTAAHDLRAPLAALMGNVQLTQMRLNKGGMPGEEELRGRLDTLNDLLKRLLSTTEEITDAAYLQMGQELSLKIGPVDVSALAQGAMRLISEGKQEVSAPIHLALPSENAPTINGDYRRLERVLQNVIDNAVKYSPEGTPVEVAVQQTESGVVITVRDHGVGIPASDLPHLFTPFYRASTARGISGTGLGLAGSKRIVEQHGGDLRVESAVGEGTAVTITLPCGAKHP